MSHGIYLSGWITIKDLKIPISKMRLKFVCWDNFTPSPEIIHLFSNDNSFVYVKVMSWYSLSPSLIYLASIHSRGTRYPAPGGGGAMSHEHMLHEESVTWKIMTSSVKTKFGNGLLTSNCCGSSCKKFNSGFQFQFQGFQFHQFQFQFRNWNWNWVAIPIPELNWPQPWSYQCGEMTQNVNICLCSLWKI